MKIYSIDKYLVIQNESMYIFDYELKKMVSVDIAKQLNLYANKRKNSINLSKPFIKNTIMKYLTNNGKYQIVEVM